ncbi:MAG: xerD [Gammaproteobacteria bacterium]|jgi:acyl-CoA thioesterase YciA|nr:xerD [Gammaproteobacteria bacterium]
MPDLTPVKLPDGQPVQRVTARPNEANPGGDLFGGWIMSEIDISGAIVAVQRAKGPVVTVAVQSLTFLAPVFVYDVLSFYGTLVSTGTTSLTVKIEVFAERFWKGESLVLKVSDATLVYVAVESPGVKRALPPVMA